MKKKYCVADRKVITLLMYMKAQMQVLAHQHQLAKNGNFGGKPTPKLPDGIVLPLQVIDQLMTLERKLTRSQEEKQMWYCAALEHFLSVICTEVTNTELLSYLLSYSCTFSCHGCNLFDSDYST